MAGIVSSGTAGGTPFAATGADCAPATPAIGTAAPAGQAQNAFTQLIAQMLEGPIPQGVAAADIAAMDATAGAFDLPSEDTEADTDDAEDGEGDVLGIAALLPGLPALTSLKPGPAPDAGAHTAEPIEGAMARRAEIAVAQTAIDELAGEAADAADPSLTSTETAAAPTGASNTHSPAQLHALLATHARTGADAAPDATLRAPVGTPAWKDELGTQLTWMAVNGREAASLRLSPEHLGPLEIRISMREGEASVHFGAANADTRSALEQSLPRLREMFASQGLVLADAGVSRDAPRNAFKPSAQPNQLRGVSDAAADGTVSSATLPRLGLVDTYV